MLTSFGTFLVQLQEKYIAALSVSGKVYIPIQNGAAIYLSLNFPPRQSDVLFARFCVPSLPSEYHFSCLKGKLSWARCILQRAFFVHFVDYINIRNVSKSTTLTGFSFGIILTLREISVFSNFQEKGAHIYGCKI